MKKQKEGTKFFDRNITVGISREAHLLLENYMHKYKLDSLGKALDRILFQKK